MTTILKKQKNYLQVWIWYTTGHKAIQFYKAIKKNCVVKREQIDLTIQLHKLIKTNNHYKLSESERNLRNNLVKRIKNLKHEVQIA